MGSTRFPGKTTEQLCGMPILSVLLMRLKCCKELDAVILGTSDHPRDAILTDLSNSLGIPSVTGPENDVLQRFLIVSSHYPSKYVVRVCADNPLTDPQEIDRLVRYIKTEDHDYAYNNRSESGLPGGVGAEAITTSLLSHISKETNMPYYREHVVLYAYENKDRFSVGYPVPPPHLNRPDIDLDVDYPEDLSFLNDVCSLLPNESAPFWKIPDIINVIDNNPSFKQ